MLMNTLSHVLQCNQLWIWDDNQSSGDQSRYSILESVLNLQQALQRDRACRGGLIYIIVVLLLNILLNLTIYIIIITSKSPDFII